MMDNNDDLLNADFQGYVVLVQHIVKKKVLYLSVRVFSTVVLIVDTVNKQTNITNRTKIC